MAADLTSRGRSWPLPILASILPDVSRLEEAVSDRRSSPAVLGPPGLPPRDPSVRRGGCDFYHCSDGVRCVRRPTGSCVLTVM